MCLAGTQGRSKCPVPPAARQATGLTGGVMSALFLGPGQAVAGGVEYACSPAIMKRSFLVVENRQLFVCLGKLVATEAASRAHCGVLVLSDVPVVHEVGDDQEDPRE